MSASQLQRSGGWGGEYGAHVPWETFDRLPWPVRELYCLAAYNYTPQSAVEQLRDGVPVAEVITGLRVRMRRRMLSEVLRLYGPDHPQAAR